MLCVAQSWQCKALASWDLTSQIPVLLWIKCRRNKIVKWFSAFNKEKVPHQVPPYSKLTIEMALAPFTLMYYYASLYLSLFFVSLPTILSLFYIDTSSLSLPAITFLKLNIRLFKSLPFFLFESVFLSL